MSQSDVGSSPAPAQVATHAPIRTHSERVSALVKLLGKEARALLSVEKEGGGKEREREKGEGEREREEKMRVRERGRGVSKCERGAR